MTRLQLLAAAALLQAAPARGFAHPPWLPVRRLPSLSTCCRWGGRGVPVLRAAALGVGGDDGDGDGAAGASGGLQKLRLRVPAGADPSKLCDVLLEFGCLAATLSFGDSEPGGYFDHSTYRYTDEVKQTFSLL